MVCGQTDSSYLLVLFTRGGPPQRKFSHSPLEYPGVARPILDFTTDFSIAELSRTSIDFLPQCPPFSTLLDILTSTEDGPQSRLRLLFSVWRHYVLFYVFMLERSVSSRGAPMTLLYFRGSSSVQLCVAVLSVSKARKGSKYLTLTIAKADVFHGGFGHHEVALTLTDPEKLVIGGKFLLVLSLLYLAAVVFPKLAILAIYLRIFVQPRFRTACYVLATLLIANWVGNTVAGLLMCKPLQYLWDQTITRDHTLTGGHCFHINVWMRWASLINIITDVAMLGLPLPVTWKLHTSRSVKIGLTITFATGSV